MGRGKHINLSIIAQECGQFQVKFCKNKTRCVARPAAKDVRRLPGNGGEKFLLTDEWNCGILSKHLRPEATHAGVAELADARDLKSRGSDPVPVRPRSPAPYRGVEQLVARRAHNPEVAGSSPVPATRNPLISVEIRGLFLLFITFSGGSFLWSFSDPDFDPYGNPDRSGLETAR